MNYIRRLPTFESWLESTRFGCLGSDVKLTDNIGLRGWWFNIFGISGVKGKGSLDTSDMVSIPTGDYIIGDHDFEYILLTPKEDSEKPSYLIKRGDFEEIKNKVKA